MLVDKLKDYTLILASGSPRRQQFFKELGLNFKVILKPVNEVFPEHLKGTKISDYLAELKANAFTNSLSERDILITSDTVVWHKNKQLGKPKDRNDALSMLKTLSGDWHDVITSVSFTTPNQQQTVNHTTKVKFKELNDSEIQFYVDTFEPYDKAGGYGIQEWIGLIGIEEIRGSYPNVVGLPTHLVYKMLDAMTNG